MKPLLTTAEVAEILRERPENVARRCAAGQIRAVRIGGEWRISEDDLATFIAPTTKAKSPRVRSTAGRRRQW